MFRDYIITHTYIFNYVHITKGSISTAFAPMGFFFFKQPSSKG